MGNTHFLLLDVGNTNIKAALATQDGLVGRAVALPTAKDGAGLARAVSGLCAEAGTKAAAIALSAVSSVVPGVDLALARVVEELTGRQPLFVPHDLPFAFANMAEIPGNVGADRLAGAYGAMRACPDAPGLVVIDFGTATTVDCVHEGAYLGGFTCPGLRSSADALSARAALLPELTLRLDKPEPTLGFGTMQSLNQGFIFGFAGLAEGLTARLEPLIGGDATVVATGGMAATVASVCPVIDHVRPDLVLEGLLAAALERTAKT